MDKYRCIPCGYIYDPEIGDPDGGISPGTSFEDIPEDWQCPICSVGKEDFEVIEEALLSKNEKIANVSVENHKIILAC